MIAFWFRKLRIGYIGTIDLLMNERGTWLCRYRPTRKRIFGQPDEERQSA